MKEYQGNNDRDEKIHFSLKSHRMEKTPNA